MTASTIRMKLALMLALSPSLIVGQTSQAPSVHRQWEWQRQEELSWRVTLSRQKLQPSERKRLISVLADELRDTASEDSATAEQLQRLAADTRIKYVDLNGDGKPEVIAQAGAEEAGCSPTGNCPFWILRSGGGSYDVLLKGEAQTFTIQHTRTNGYFDIVLNRHGSAFESEARTFIFDGNSYHENSCDDVQWSPPDDHGKSHPPKPILVPCGTNR